MYRNLAAEMARKGIRKKDIADLLGVGYITALEKTKGKRRFYLDEAVKIKKAFFPDLRLEYLFATDDTKSVRGAQDFYSTTLRSQLTQMNNEMIK